MAKSKKKRKATAPKLDPNERVAPQWSKVPDRHLELDCGGEWLVSRYGDRTLLRKLDQFRTTVCEIVVARGQWVTVSTHSVVPPEQYTTVTCEVFATGDVRTLRSTQGPISTKRA